MFKNNEHTEKQRFSIKKYSFGVTSALVGVFLAAGANAAQAEEVKPAPTTPAPSVAPAPAAKPAATTQAAPAPAAKPAATTQAAPAPAAKPAATTQAAPAPVAPAATTQAVPSVAPKSTTTQPVAPKPVAVVGKNGDTISENGHLLKVTAIETRTSTGKEEHAMVSLDVMDTNNKKLNIPDEVEVKETGKKYTVKEVVGRPINKAHIEEVSLPSQLESVFDDQLKDMNVKKLEFPKTLKRIGGLNGSVASKALEEVSLYQVEGAAQIFKGADNLKKVNLLGEWTKIPSGMFAGSVIEEAVIPEGVKEISAFAFQDSKLKKITLPTTLETIGEAAFANTKLEEITIPENIVEINNPFSNTPNLKNIYLPKNFGENNKVYPYIYKSAQSLDFVAPNFESNMVFSVFDSQNALNKDGLLTYWVYKGSQADLKLQALRARLDANNKANNKERFKLFDIKYREETPVVAPSTTQAAPKTATTMAKNTPPANSDLMINPSGLVSAWSTDGKQLREARWLSNIYEGEVIPGYEFENTFFGEAGVYQEYRKIDETTQAAPKPASAPTPAATTQAAQKPATTMAKNTPPANSELMINPSGEVSAWSTDGEKLREARWLSNIYEGEVIPGYEFENTFFGEQGPYQEYRKVDASTQAPAQTTAATPTTPTESDFVAGTYVANINGKQVTHVLNRDLTLGEGSGKLQLDKTTKDGYVVLTVKNAPTAELGVPQIVVPAGKELPKGDYVTLVNPENNDLTKERILIPQMGGSAYVYTLDQAAPTQTPTSTQEQASPAVVNPETSKVNEVVYDSNWNGSVVVRKGKVYSLENGNEIGSLIGDSKIGIYPAGKALPTDVNIPNIHVDDITKDRLLIQAGRSSFVFVINSSVQKGGLTNTGIVPPLTVDGVQDLRPFIKEDLAALAKIKAAQAGKTTAKVSNKATQSKSAAKSTRKAGANVLPKTSATETNSALPAGLAAALVAAGLMTAKRRKN